MRCMHLTVRAAKEQYLRGISLFTSWPQAAGGAGSLEDSRPVCHSLCLFWALLMGTEADSGDSCWSGLGICRYRPPLVGMPPGCGAVSLLRGETRLFSFVLVL